VSAEATKVGHHAQPTAQENAWQESLGQYEQFYFVISGLKIIG
jgi:hypothetical protein